MSKLAHRIYLFFMVFVVIVVFAWLIYKGQSYYNTSIEERFFHASHNSLKPSGTFGHGFGIIGTFFMIFGILSYMARKRFRFLSRWGNLKHWLEFHIFLCTLGPILVLFHTSFKFGGIVSVSFWSMVIVFLSGIVGRFIYIQIPRSIEGRELSLKEVRGLKTDIGEYIRNTHKLNEESFTQVLHNISKITESKTQKGISHYFHNVFDNRKTIRLIRGILSRNRIPKPEIHKIIGLIKEDLSLNRKIERLVTMQKLFNYWHVAHLPFALVMLVIMVIHVVITIVFGYKWIF